MLSSRYFHCFFTFAVLQLIPRTERCRKKECDHPFSLSGSRDKIRRFSTLKRMFSTKKKPQPIMLFFFYGVNKYELWILSKSTLWFTYLIKKIKKIIRYLAKKIIILWTTKKKMIFKKPNFFCKLIYFRHTSIIINII